MSEHLHSFYICLEMLLTLEDAFLLVDSQPLLDLYLEIEFWKLWNAGKVQFSAGQMAWNVLDTFMAFYLPGLKLVACLM